MAEKFKLKRTVQCVKCPWKVDTNPYDIPGGYSTEKHKKLSCTIAKEAIFSKGNLHAMACHHSEPGEEEHCVGWLYNQLGRGNNIMLRIKMMSCENIGELKIVGKQHERFEDTLPEE